MSTRANIVLKDSDYNEHLWFYRHYDGYPDGALPTLGIFLKWVGQGDIRNIVEQAGGWLIMIGAAEYDTLYEDGERRPKIAEEIFKPNSGMMGWKVGAYEPAVGLRPDIEYLYVVELSEPVIEVYNTWPSEGEIEQGLEGYTPIQVIEPDDISESAIAAGGCTMKLNTGGE